MFSHVSINLGDCYAEIVIFLDNSVYSLEGGFLLLDLLHRLSLQLVLWFWGLLKGQLSSHAAKLVEFVIIQCDNVDIAEPFAQLQALWGSQSVFCLSLEINGKCLKVCNKRGGSV